MSKKMMMRAGIIRQETLISGVHSLWLKAPEVAKEAKAGQFVSLYLEDGVHLLPRPISLCEIDKENGAIRLVYREAGAGTKYFAGLSRNATVRVLGPLGNGYPALTGTLLLVGGGIGIPPLLALGKHHKEAGGRVVSVMGYKDKTFLTEDFEHLGALFIATEDGSRGMQGTVLDAIAQQEMANAMPPHAIAACGPAPMLRAVKEWALQENIPCYLSLEERMACGIGACLGCVCKATETDAHSMVKKKRVCKDGPVFLSTEVVL